MTQYHTAGSKARILIPSLCNAKTTLSPSHHMVSLKERSVFQPCGLPPPSTISSCKLGPCFPPLLTATAREAQGALNPRAICTMLAGWQSPRILACAGGSGFPHCCNDGHRVPRARLANLIYHMACVFVHINISLPLIIHLTNFKGALHSQLGFYHIYMLHFSSEACQWCTFKAFPSLTEGLAAFTGQALKGILPWPGPTRLPSVHPDMGDPMPERITYWHTKWAMKTGPPSKR